MSDCIFCKMASGEIKPDVVYEANTMLTFRDINPQAPTHVLVIPKRHIPTLNDVEPNDRELIGDLYLVAQEVARREGIAESGYRTVFNCRGDGGQEVYHLHLHVLGGRRMQWPPG